MLVVLALVAFQELSTTAVLALVALTRIVLNLAALTMIGYQ